MRSELPTCSPLPRSRAAAVPSGSSCGPSHQHVWPQTRRQPGGGGESGGGLGRGGGGLGLTSVGTERVSGSDAGGVLGLGLDLLLSRRMLVWPNHCMSEGSHSVLLADWAWDVSATVAAAMVVVLGCASLCRGGLACGGGGLPARTGQELAYVVNNESPLRTERDLDRKESLSLVNDSSPWWIFL